MIRLKRNYVVGTTILALVLGLVPAQASSGARLEGLLVDVDGRAASGYRVHLIDARGADVAQTSASPAGLYSFRDLPSGEYSLGIESPEGLMAPVAAPPVRLGPDELERRDIKLVQSNDAQREAIGNNEDNGGFGLWWAGLSPAAKAWTIIGTLALFGITFAALQNESDSTPITPPAP